MRADTTPGFAGALQATVIRPALFVSIAFEDNTVNVWSGIGTVTPQGPSTDPLNTFPYGVSFVGVGEFGGISAIPSTTDVIAQSISVKLSGIPSNLVAETIAQVRLTSECSIWMGLFDQNGNLIDHPIRLFGPGAADVPTITDDGETCSLEITFENALISLQLAANRRFTDIDQQLDFPGDTGMAYVSIEQNLFLGWPFFAQADSDASPPATANGVTLSPLGPIVLTVGGQQQMAATCEFQVDPRQDGDPGVEVVTATGLWASADSNVCLVTNGTGSNLPNGDFGTGGGLITALGPGIATVTFIFGTVSASITVIVLDAT